LLAVDLALIEKSKKLISLFLLLGIERGKKQKAKKPIVKPLQRRSMSFLLEELG
jgi:hypothetical protein